MSLAAAPHGRSHRRFLLAFVLGVALVALTAFAVQASTWVLVHPDGLLADYPAAVRVALLWLIAALGPVTVVWCARVPPTRPLLSQAAARAWAPWLTLAVLAWVGFIYWLGFIGAGAQGRTLAFTIVFCCASVLTPLAAIEVAFRRRFFACLLPAVMLAVAIGLYTVHYEEFFGLV